MVLSAEAALTRLHSKTPSQKQYSPAERGGELAGYHFLASSSNISKNSNT